MPGKRIPRLNHRSTGAAPAGLLILIVVALILAVAVPSFLNTDRQADQPAEAATEPAPSILDPLDPTPFRAEIAALEKALYVDEITDLSGGISDIVTLANDLAQAVYGDGLDSHRNRTHIIVYRFVRSARRRTEWSTDTDLESLRERWEYIRDQAFKPAPWFRGERDGGSAQSWQVERVAAPGTVGRLEDLCNRLESLIDQGQSAALAIGEVGGAAGASGQQTERRWREWCQTWVADVQQLTRSYPARLDSRPPVDLALAHSELGVALEQLRLLGSLGDDTANRVPTRENREKHFLSASWHTEQARAYLARLSP